MDNTPMNDNDDVQRTSFDDARTLGTISSVCISLAAAGSTFVNTAQFDLQRHDYIIIRLSIFALIVASGMAIDAIFDLVPEPHWRWLARTITNKKAKERFLANGLFGSMRRLYVYSGAYALFAALHAAMLFWLLYDPLYTAMTAAELLKIESVALAKSAILFLSISASGMLFTKMMTHAIRWSAWAMLIFGWFALGGVFFAAVRIVESV